MPDFDIQQFVPPEHRKSLKIMSRAMRFGVAASTLAVRDSGLDLDREDPERVGVVMGTGLVPIDLPEVAPLPGRVVRRQRPLAVDRLGQRGSGALFPLWLLKYLPNMVAAHISMIHNAQGPNSTITTACCRRHPGGRRGLSPDPARRRRHRAGRRRR